MHTINTVGIVGSGVIASGWAARFLAHGLDVLAADPGSGAEARLRAGVERAWPALATLGLMPTASRDRLRFTDDLEMLCTTAQFIQESVPEQEALQRNLFRALDAVAPAEVVIASSSSGLLPSDIQAGCRYPGRVIVGHPCDPVYLLPLVEVGGGARTLAAAIETAMAFYRWVGMHPLYLHKETAGRISDRLRAALWNEARQLVGEGGVSAEAIDAAVVYGPGLCWAVLGASPQQHAADESSAALEQLRDDCLIDIMRTLRQHNHASGRIIAALDAKRYTSYRHSRWTPDAEIGRPLRLYDGAVDPSWIDYNGHMTESSYLAAFGDASDALFRYVGIDEAYRAAGHSFYTVETHINYYKEVGSGEPLRFTTQLLGLDARRLHLFHTMLHGITGAVLATTEQLLLHVDTRAGAAGPMKPYVYAALSAIVAAHTELPAPRQVGRQIAIEQKS